MSSRLNRQSRIAHSPRFGPVSRATFRTARYRCDAGPRRRWETNRNTITDGVRPDNAPPRPERSRPGRPPDGREERIVVARGDRPQGEQNGPALNAGHDRRHAESKGTRPGTLTAPGRRK